MKTHLAMECAEEFGIKPDCDCPHEHWHLVDFGACLDIHFEPDNSVRILLLGSEEFEAETTLTNIPTIAGARGPAFAWAETKLQ